MSQVARMFGLDDSDIVFYKRFQKAVRILGDAPPKREINLFEIELNPLS